jgi:hypothetical protein
VTEPVLLELTPMLDYLIFAPANVEKILFRSLVLGLIVGIVLFFVIPPLTGLGPLLCLIGGLYYAERWSWKNYQPRKQTRTDTPIAEVDAAVMNACAVFRFAQPPSSL